MTHDRRRGPTVPLLGLIVGMYTKVVPRRPCNCFSRASCVRAASVERTQRFVGISIRSAEHRMRCESRRAAAGRPKLIHTLPSELPSPTRSIWRGLLDRRSARATPRRANPKATFRPTDIIGNMASCWNYHIDGASIRRDSRMLLSADGFIAAKSGAMNPASSSNVVLPPPDGHQNREETAAFDRKGQRFTAACSAKRFVTASADHVRVSQFSALMRSEDFAFISLSPRRNRRIPMKCSSMCFPESRDEFLLEAGSTSGAVSLAAENFPPI